MRILGEIPHPTYKITILHMNGRFTLQIEDRLLSQSYVFRDGSSMDNIASFEKLLSPKFLSNVDQLFEKMKQNYYEALDAIHNESNDTFEII